MARKEKRVGVLEAKTHLCSLLRDVENGTVVIVVRAGRPVARILGADPELSAAARQAIARAGPQAAVSVATIWEASIKRAAGKLAGPDLLDAVTASGLPLLRIDEHHAKLAGELPLLHRDPFDRMLVAQAMIDGLAIVTSDGEIPRYGIAVVW